jgi:hypothetical protein
MHHQLDFGTYDHHYHHTHYLLAHHPHDAPDALPARYSHDTIRRLTR